MMEDTDVIELSTKARLGFGDKMWFCLGIGVQLARETTWHRGCEIPSSAERTNVRDRRDPGAYSKEEKESVVDWSCDDE